MFRAAIFFAQLYFSRSYRRATMIGWVSRAGWVRLGLVGACGLLVLAALVPATAFGDNSTVAHLCQQNGWKTLVRADGTSFASQDACVSYGANGGKLGQTVTFTSPNPSPVTVGDPAYTPTATASSGLSVTFTLDAASSGCSLTAGHVSFTAGGTCVIDANQAGNGSWAAATQKQQAITITKKSQTISFTSANPSPVLINQPGYTPAATASSGLTVVITLDASSSGCSLSSGVVSFTAAGTCLIAANQAGNATWAAATQQQQAISINKKPQTVSFTSPNPSPVTALDPSYTPTATATSGLPVTITLDATSTGCSLAAGVVSFTAGGTCLIAANQAGNGTWAAATQVQQAITITACISTDAQLRAAAAAGGSYCLTASAPIAVTGGEVVVGSTLSLTSSGPGNATVTAQQNSRVFNVTGSLTLTNVTVTGGQVHGQGGGISVGTTGSVVLNGQTTVTGNAAWNGAGVYLVGYPGAAGVLTMNDSASVSNNSANPFGDNVTTEAGGVFVGQAASLIMNGASSVRGNQVGGGDVSLGGGLVDSAGHITLNDFASISGNAVLVSRSPLWSRGGGVYFVNGGSLALNGSSSITGNSAVDYGGGIYRIDAGLGTITGVTDTNVSGNTPNNCAYLVGGATPPVLGCVG
jgi:hypothetical protein